MLVGGGIKAGYVHGASDRIGAYPHRAVAIVTGLRHCGPRTGVALCEPSSRLGRPCNLRSGLARYRRRYPCIATRQTNGAANAPILIPM